MINNDKWIGSLPKINLGSSDKKNQINHEKWINTIQKKSSKHSMQKYSLVVVLFFCGSICPFVGNSIYPSIMIYSTWFYIRSYICVGKRVDPLILVYHILPPSNSK